MSPASRLHARGAAFALLLALTAGVLFAPSQATAQQPGPPKKKVEIAADGTELFRALLDRKGIKPIKQQELRNLRRYDDVIVIILGEQRVSNIGQPIDYGHAAIGNGGAALVATDTSLNLDWAAIGGRGQARIVGAPVECTAPDEVLAVRDPDDPPGAAPKPLPNCPYVVPVFSPVPRTAPHRDTPAGAIFRDLTRVATNSPGYITAEQLAGEFRFSLARFPENTFSLRMPLRQHWFAVGGTGDGAFNDYRFLAMADHSVFINQMLIEPGTDNLELTYRTIDFLHGPQQRKRCLFIENGRVVENFDTLRQAFASQSPIPIPNPGAMQENSPSSATRWSTRSSRVTSTTSS
jgi:hypothetical protein